MTDDNHWRDQANWLRERLDVSEACVKELEDEVKRLESRFTAPIVCICGSTKFKQSWITENARLTGEGNVVLAVGLWGHHERVFPDAKTKLFLDELHKRKIDLCDWVWVLDIGGYIGESTQSEIEYAEKAGRPVRYLSQEFPDYVEPVDPLEARVLELEAEVERLQLSIKNEFILSQKKMHRVAQERTDWGNSQVARAKKAEARVKELETEVKRLQAYIARLGGAEPNNTIIAVSEYSASHTEERLKQTKANIREMEAKLERLKTELNARNDEL